MKRIVILFISLVLLSSCMVYNYTPLEPALRESLVGLSYAQIIRVYGAPNREMPDGSGGSILIYENYYANSYTNHYSEYFSSTTTSQNRNYKELYINSSGRCYNVRSNMFDTSINWPKTMLGNAAYAAVIVILLALASSGG